MLMTDVSETALARALQKAKEVTPDRLGTIATMKCDVTRESDVKAAIESMDEYGGVDIVFNNAGIMNAKDDGMSHTRTRHSTADMYRCNRHSRGRLGLDFRHQREGSVVW